MAITNNELHDSDGIVKPNTLKIGGLAFLAIILGKEAFSPAAWCLVGNVLDMSYSLDLGMDRTFLGRDRQLAC